MKSVSSLLVFLAASNALSNAVAETATASAGVIAPYVHQGRAYPPVLFVSNIDDVDIKALLEASHAFASLDKEAIGLPIGVRVLHGSEYNRDGAMVTSGLLAAGTLGLVPIMANKTYTVLYDVFVQGRSIARFEYDMAYQDVENIWLQDKQSGLSADEKKFLADSVPRFLNDLKGKQEAQALFDEYHYYFSAP